MHRKNTLPHLSAVMLLLFLVSSACSALATPAPTETPKPTLTPTKTATPTKTPKPTSTPRPTATPNLAATQKYEDYEAEIQSYVDAGYLSSTDGSIKEIDDFSYDWAQLGWYKWLQLGKNVSDFSMTAHFRWSSAYRNADESGCGFIFAINDGGHYALFLDRAKVIFLDADSSYGSYALPVGKTRGTGRVKFDNPFEHPVEADFTLIVNDHTAYVLVNNEMIGQYTLSQSRILKGDVGLTVLSGTNKDYGTRCSMTDIHIFSPK